MNDKRICNNNKEERRININFNYISERKYETLTTTKNSTTYYRLVY